MDYYSLFRGPTEISTIEEPRGAFTFRSSALAVVVDLTHFMDYYSPFWGPNTISMVVGPLGALKCQSSILIVLTDSGAFLGLLLTVLGSQRDFHD